ncbi:Smr/MutS family protein [Actibacterium sp. 188UL27-1]|uniref:Smr/MutS family protein n=1 Tax=Actibacterium sp. 188UL27-1 TaxID=2786961 RepID=UPI001EF407E7|nr:Smr/MutS family protein [Actibacterium sp. 188UL27-1]
MRPDELALWQQVARTATPLNKPKARQAAEEAGPVESPVTPPAEIPKFDMAQTARPSGGASIAYASASSKAAPQMDSKKFVKMRSGKLDPDARIDLHGMTLNQAHPALNGFVLSSHRAGRRLLLVITGKGKTVPDDGPIPSSRGVLRRHVPQWLRLPPLSAIVLEVTPAHIRHGGDGAYYVYLRRAR